MGAFYRIHPIARRVPAMTEQHRPSGLWQSENWTGCIRLFTRPPDPEFPARGLCVPSTYARS